MVNQKQPDMKKSPGLSEVLGYYFRKNDPGRPRNFNLRAMHTINKISILMFLVGVIMVVLKLAMR
jgi:hypothetical protein